MAQRAYLVTFPRYGQIMVDNRDFVLEVFIGSGNSRFPFFPWEPHGNNLGIIWVREWELLCGNGREWE